MSEDSKQLFEEIQARLGYVEEQLAMLTDFLAEENPEHVEEITIN